ncbi:MAG: hypothetical protein IID43_04600, partial [Planctomycetes bacterium]|nr:hypothetical protein [Planctomycetota bacterium]
ARRVSLPELEPGPLQVDVLEPKLISLGIITARVPQAKTDSEPQQEAYDDYWEDEEDGEPSNVPEMLKALFDAKLASPEEVYIQSKWIAGSLFAMDCDFYAFCKSCNLIKNEGLVMRHLLRLTIVAGEFATRSGGDPEYERIGALATRVCQGIDPSYTDRFLAAEEESKKLAF